MMARWIDERRNELLDFTAALVATPSPNLPGDERAVVEVIQEKMRQLGLPPGQIVAKDPTRPNLLLRLKGQRPGPTLMLCGHTDTKPVGDASRWKTDPLKPVIADGKLYGLGSTDMKAAVAAMVYAVAALNQCDTDYAGDILLALVADEEYAATYGSEFLAREYPLDADIALLGEPSGISGKEFEYLHLLSRGISCFKVRVFGTQMHSSLSDRLPAVNASVKLAEVLTRMNKELKLTFTPHALCRKPTVNLGNTLSGGVNYGVYPGVAEFKADIRTLPGMTRDQLASDINTFLDTMRREDASLKVELEFEKPPMDWRPATEVPEDHPFVGVLLSTAEQVLGWQPQVTAFPGATDAMSFQGIAGIPTIPSFGPGWLPLAHGPNECVGLDATVDAARIYALAAQQYLTMQ